MSHSTLMAGIASLLSLSTLLLANPCQAFVINHGIKNGSFETGNLEGWTPFSNTSVQTSAFGSGPTAGTYQALLDTSDTPDDTFSSLEQFLSLSPGTLNQLGNGEYYGGSAILQSFKANAGDTLSFNWNFLTDEDLPSSFNDFAFVVALSDSSTLANTSSTFVASATSFANETGFQNFSQKMLAAGEYTLGIGVVNVTDGGGRSGLLVDNVTLTPETNASKPVPEPLTILGSSMALGFGALFHKKSSKQRNNSTKR